MKIYIQFKFFKKIFHIQKISDTVLLFCAIFFIYGIFVNSNDQNSYTLQQAGIEAIAERGTLYVDGSPTPKLKRPGDVFNHEGHLYAAKQPGQFFIGTIIYFILYIIGITYENSYLLTSSLVTWFTSGAMTSLIVVMLFKIGVFLTKNKKFSFLVAIFYGLGTISFPYCGVTHHDIYGTFLIFASFYFLFLSFHSSQVNKTFCTVVSGITAGVSIFTSALPVFILLGLLLYILTFKKWKHLFLFLIVFTFSVSPLFLYNYYAFGSPFLPANIAGNFNDTYPAFSLNNILGKIHFYFLSPKTSIYAFSPIIVLSFFGIFFIRKEFFREKLFLILQFVFLISYLINMSTVGHCQYGPRYLLPTLPFLILGLCPYWTDLNSGLLRKTLNTEFFKRVVIISGCVSIIICSIGALHGTMYCSLNIWAFKYYIGKTITGNLPEFPLMGISVLLLAITLIIWAIKYNENIWKYYAPDIASLKKELLRINRLWLTSNAYLLFIIFLAIFLRLINLHENPNGFYSDEASIGYNAYSVLQTGKDEHGTLLPLYFKAFGEYKNPVYIYAVIPFIKIFGLNVFAVRFTAAMFGMLTVFFTYLLAKEIFNKRVGLWAAFFLAVTPWHIQFSRIAFEAISLPCLFTIGYYFLLKGLKNGKYLLFSAAIFALTLYTYAPAKLFVPLFLLVFLIINYRRLFQHKTELFLSLLIGFFFLLPLLNFTFNGPGQTRYNIISIFTKHSLNATKNGILNDRYWSLPFFKDLVDYKSFLIPYSFLRNYSLHMSPNFLFFRGDGNSRHNIGAMGQLFQFEGILIVLGIIFLVLCIRKKKGNAVLLWWFLLFPVSASLTYESIPHAIRSIYGLPVFQIIAAVGLVSTIAYVRSVGIKHQQFKKYINYPLIVLTGSFIIFSICNVSNYFWRYYKIYSETKFGAWSYGIKEAIQITDKLKNTDTVSFMNMGNKYIYILFHTKYDPQKWQKSKIFDKYKYNTINRLVGRKQVLIVNAGEYASFRTIQTIYFPDGKAGIEIKEVGERKFKEIPLSDVRPELIGGLKGSYFNGKNFEKFVLSRTDRKIDFNWGLNSPCQRINEDNFSVRWDGLIRIDESGDYTFYTVSDDGVRLKIDGYIVIDNWTKHSATEDKSEISMKKGWHKISIEYNDVGKSARIKLLWSSSSINKSLVPSTHLSFL